MSADLRFPSAPGIVPPYLLARIAAVPETRWERAAHAARATLEVHREYRPAPAAAPRIRSAVSSTPAAPREIADAQHREELPGVVVRREGEPPTADAVVDEAYDGLGATASFFRDVYGRAGIDAEGGRLLASVHYGRAYDNAFWNGERMVFGDGDGEVFRGFTGSLSVIAHELAHGVTEDEGGLDYVGQSGALNESLSDVFGVLTEQHARWQTAREASWLVGAEIFTEQVQGMALRSLAQPGTAYDDDVLGRDPQPGHVRDFVVTAACTSTPASPTRRSTSSRPHSADGRGSARAASGTTPSSPASSPERAISSPSHAPRSPPPPRCTVRSRRKPMPCVRPGPASV